MTANTKCAKSAFTQGRNGATFVPMALSKTRRREIGERVKALRQRSPVKGPVLAEKLHVTYRQYQNYENPGPGDFETVERIAKLHWRLWAKHDPESGFVSAGWIWDGKDRRKSPDVLSAIGALNDVNKEHLERIEAMLVDNAAKLDELLTQWDARWALLEADETAQELPQAEQRSARESSSRDRIPKASGRPSSS